MQIGKLDKRITLRTQSAGQDSAGQPGPGWTNITPDVWASIRYNSGVESIKAGADTSIVKASLRIRYRSGVNAGMRAVCGTQVFDIKAVLPNQRKGYIDLVCEVANVAS